MHPQNVFQATRCDLRTPRGRVGTCQLLVLPYDVTVLLVLPYDVLPRAPWARVTVRRMT